MFMIYNVIEKKKAKFMTSQSGKQTITLHRLPNISRSKGNQTIKFGQLIECNMRKISLEKSDPFVKN